MEEFWLPILYKSLKGLYQLFYDKTRRNKDEVKKGIMRDILDNRVILLPITQVKEELITDEKIIEVVKKLQYHNIDNALENEYDFNKFFRVKNKNRANKIKQLFVRILEIIRSLREAPIINYKEKLKELIELIVKLGELLRMT